jgi:hypothetical protein
MLFIFRVFRLLMLQGMEIVRGRTELPCVYYSAERRFQSFTANRDLAARSEHVRDTFFLRSTVETVCQRSHNRHPVSGVRVIE